MQCVAYAAIYPTACRGVVDWEMVRRTMNCFCGMSRNEERLIAARNAIDSIRKSINKFYWSYKVSRDFLETRNIADTAAIIIDSALARRETRACHIREDFPETDDKDYGGITLVRKNGSPVIQRVQ